MPQDYVKAAYWLRKAAEQGYAGAQYKLGAMYSLGVGVPQDYVQAAKWFILAKASGYDEGGNLLHSTEQVMTSAQIAEAQSLAREWWTKHHKR
ncbi:MAG: tetratricopeptide repeat protein [Candidatus Micrarchaeaceae archaeon]